MSIELAEAEAYQEAYEALAEEMRGIVARNEVAEEEAHRLSQFNAEILSHHNPTQRIFYVDRVRRELAETKQVSQSIVALFCILMPLFVSSNSP